ncbi:MAG: hypothetical protein H7238_05465 [Polaromonas sp.]|nr:hypothetical protein [Polaromonas sp.]
MVGTPETEPIAADAVGVVGVGTVTLVAVVLVTLLTVVAGTEPISMAVPDAVLVVALALV